MSHEDISHRFAFHAATTQEKKDDHSSVRAMLGNTAHFIEEYVPAGREKALAITKLEEAMFWANAAIARAANELDLSNTVMTVADAHAILTRGAE